MERRTIAKINNDLVDVFGLDDFKIPLYAISQEKDTTYRLTAMYDIYQLIRDRMKLIVNKNLN